MSILYDGTMQAHAFKEVLADTLQTMCHQDQDVIYLDADLMSCIGMDQYAKAHPDRAINCGIAESNMVGVACGLAAVGFKPVIHTFGPFASRRCFDQVFLSAGYAKNDITIIGTDPGVTAMYNGGTHMPFEDIALYRTIPTATIIDITDEVMLKELLPKCVNLPGVKYIRVGRKYYAKVFAEDTEMTIGKALTLREGKDAVVFATGILVHEAMKAANLLEQEGISVAVVNPFTIKPLDEDAILHYAKSTGTVVAAENHNRIGGLCSAIADLLCQRYPVAMECVAVEDCYGEVGPQDYLQERFGLTADHVAEAVKKAIGRKQKK